MEKFIIWLIGDNFLKKLFLYNTISKKKEEFIPIDSSNIRMYVCGPTLYDSIHIGNARPIIVFDVLFRLLRHIYGQEHVTYVRNITDIDDKIIKKAEFKYQEFPIERSIEKLLNNTISQYHSDVKTLNCLSPTYEPLATNHINDMIAMIEKLVSLGFAYISNNHVLFSITYMNKHSKIEHGTLSNRTLESSLNNNDVINAYKRNINDFVLWKPSKENEPSWNPPCGIPTRGRPGWHIECSAMANHYLGETFDIHGGGVDLVFPHHENEISQTCCAFNVDKMANVFMHNGTLKINGHKMSKSENNFITVHDLLNTNKFGGRSWNSNTIRMAMIKTHYRKPIDWTLESLINSEKLIELWKNSVQNINDLIPSFEVINTLFDDLNSGTLFKELHILYKNKKFNELKWSLNLLGFCDL